MKSEKWKYLLPPEEGTIRKKTDKRRIAVEEGQLFEAKRTASRIEKGRFLKKKGPLRQKWMRKMLTISVVANSVRNIQKEIYKIDL